MPSFAVGAILLGSISFLPTYLQIVKGASATASGLGLLPLIAGLLLTSTASGLLVSRTGRYRALPILGFGVNTTGLFLMSTMGVDTPMPSIAAYLFVFGFGLGLVMQVLTVAVQNVVTSADLGAATSGVSVAWWNPRNAPIATGAWAGQGPPTAANGPELDGGVV